MVTRFIIPLLILALGYGAWTWLGTPAEPPKLNKQPARLIKTERLILNRTNFPIVLESQGTVRAHHEATVTSQVPGTVIKVHPEFEDGAFFREGQILIELDAGDLKAKLSSAESRLARAEAQLAQEEAKAKQARLNWEDIGYEEEPSPLVLRIPQLKDAQAQLKAASTDVDQAQRELARAKVRAPFDGRVKSRLVGLGQTVSGTTALGEIFATDFAEIRLPLAADQLRFVNLPKRDGHPAVPVTLTDALTTNSADEPGSWEAQIIRTEGALDEGSRELFVIARIEDPFGIQSSKAELRIGQPVRAAIKGITLRDVFLIPRKTLRGINRIYLIDQTQMTLSRQTIQPVWSTEETVIVREGIDDGTWLASSTLPYAPLGAPVEIIDSNNAMASDPDANESEKES